MNKYIITTICILFIMQSLGAQVSFYIKNISVSHYNVTIPKGLILTDLEEGPILSATCVLKNTSSNDTIKIYPDKSTINIYFFSKHFQFSSEVYPIAFNDKSLVKLAKNDSICFGFGHNLFLGTSLFKSGKYDYTKEIIEILPTIRVLYRQKDLKVYTNEIISVDAFEQ